MNIWALDKDVYLKQLLLVLEHRFSSGTFGIDACVFNNPKTVGLYNLETPGMRAYVYTLGQRANRYGVQLEFPDQYASANSLEIYEDISIEKLCEILTVHLDIPVQEQTLKTGQQSTAKQE